MYIHGFRVFPRCWGSRLDPFHMQILSSLATIGFISFKIASMSSIFIVPGTCTTNAKALCNSVCLFVCLGVYRPTREFFIIWRRHHYRWRIAHFDVYSALMAMEHWGFFRCYTYCDTGHPFIMVISEDPWHSHLLPSVWQCSCHYLF